MAHKLCVMNFCRTCRHARKTSDWRIPLQSATSRPSSYIKEIRLPTWHKNTSKLESTATGAPEETGVSETMTELDYPSRDG